MSWHFTLFISSPSSTTSFDSWVCNQTFFFSLFPSNNLQHQSLQVLSLRLAFVIIYGTTTPFLLYLSCQHFSIPFTLLFFPYIELCSSYIIQLCFRPLICFWIPAFMCLWLLGLKDMRLYLSSQNQFVYVLSCVDLELHKCIKIMTFLTLSNLIFSVQ